MKMNININLNVYNGNKYSDFYIILIKISYLRGGEKGKINDQDLTWNKVYFK